MAALASLAVNLGDLELASCQLAQRIAALPADERARARAWVQRPENRQLCVELPIVLAHFADASCSSSDAGTAATVPAAPPAGRRTGGLRNVIQHAPPQFCCALDGKLLCDPVVTPQGLVCERSTLLRCLEQNGSTCPVHGVALRIEECHRSPQLRKEITEWARRQRQLNGKRPNRNNP